MDAFLRSNRWDGLNVTIPYKKAVVPYCAELSRRKNCKRQYLIRHLAVLYGDNTDLFGFLYMVRRSGIDPAGKKARWCWAAARPPSRVEGRVGAAGRGRYRHFPATARTIMTIWIVTPTPQIIAQHHPRWNVSHNGAAAVDLRRFPRCEGVLDIVYNPARTALLLQAEELGIPHAGELSMLVAQAKRSSEQFTGTVIGDEALERVERTVNHRLRNIILIGMPGSGKSAVAAALGKALDREVVEADELIAQRTGMSIPEIFAQSGEETFRKLETEVLAEQGKRSGIILSTGGGCVTRPENYPLLHQNGTIFRLTRDLSELPTEGRPISQTTDLAQLCARREPLYRRFADVTVSMTQALEVTVQTIKEALLHDFWSSAGPI